MLGKSDRLLAGNIYQRVTSKKEIDRLCAERKVLIHGLQNGSLKPVKNHHSSKVKKKGE